MSKSNFYNVLGVSPQADKDVIQAAYYALSKKYRDSDKKLKLINEAKEVLLDDESRNEYDDELNNLTKSSLGNYKIISMLAEGGFGKTYVAEHVDLGVKVCIKHAHKISSDDEFLLKEEARSIWDLRHFGIPNIRDILKLEDGSYALVMSYIPGPTLAQYVEKHGELDAEHVAWIAQRILNTLKYLHFHGVVHGDIKPQNIIIQPEIHSCVIVDYGLSMVRPRKGTTNKGYTPLFASPEQMAGLPLLPESDFYGLGLSLIYALGGDIERKSVSSKCPDNLFNFIKKLIKFDVSERPHWQKEDLMILIEDVRIKDFGRGSSNMKPMKKF